MRDPGRRSWPSTAIVSPGDERIGLDGSRGLSQETRLQKNAGTERRCAAEEKGQGRRALLLRPETPRVAPALRFSPRVERRAAVVGGAQGPVHRSEGQAP